MEDPNKDRNDPMMPEYWQLGEDLQDKIRGFGYESETVEGIAVDVHDLLQSTARIEQVLVPSILSIVDEKADREKLLGLLKELQFEFDHIKWHCQSASDYASKALLAI